MTAPTTHEIRTATEALRRRAVAVIGAGPDVLMHALCLRDSGCDVRIGLALDDPARADAESEGFATYEWADAAADADATALVAPEELQEQIYAEALDGNLIDGDALIVSNGFGLRYEGIEVPGGVSVALVSPVAQPAVWRREFAEGRGVPVLVALAQDPDGSGWALALGYAGALGAVRAGVIVSTVAQVTDVQAMGHALALGSLPRLLHRAGETLIDAGYDPATVWPTLQQAITDVAADMGRTGVAATVAARGPWPTTLAARDVAPDAMLAGLQDGSWARAMSLGDAEAEAWREVVADHPGEEAAAALRQRMGWLHRDDSSGRRWR